MIQDPHKEFEYPPELPILNPLFTTDKTLLALAREIKEAKAWERLPEIADALEARGCTDVEVLDHFRNRWVCMWCNGQQRMTDWNTREIPCLSCVAGKHVVHNGHKYGCWCGECWLLNILLGDDQPLKAINLPALSSEGGTAIVVNQGDWFGKTWWITPGGCWSPPVYVLEADSPSDVESIFVDSDWGKAERLDLDDEHVQKDYGYQVHAGDIIGGVKMDRDGWVNLNGEYVEGTRSEPSMTYGGTLYDNDNFQWGEAPTVRYIGPGLPPEGVSPQAYSDRQVCEGCGDTFYPEKKWPHEGCCSAECVADVRGDEDDEDEGE